MKSVIEVLGDKKVRIKFAGKLNRMKDNRIIWIPKNLLDDVKELEGKQLLITLELEEIK